MFLSEKQITDYHDNLIFKIVTKHESRKLNYKDYKDDATDSIDRNTMISKIKEIESFNLEKFRSNQKNYKYCFVIQNKLAKCSITGRIRKTLVSLLVLNFFLDDEIVHKLK